MWCVCSIVAAWHRGEIHVEEEEEEEEEEREEEEKRLQNTEHKE